VLSAQAAELGALKGNDQELQQKLALLEQLTKQAEEVAARLEELSPAAPKKEKKRTQFGSTDQPALATIEQLFELDGADKTTRVRQSGFDRHRRLYGGEHVAERAQHDHPHHQRVYR
jgi:hypothetical protein